MANFSIGVIKPDIVACTVEYEKKHFKQLLETQPGIKSFFQNLYYLYNISKFFSLLAYSAYRRLCTKFSLASTQASWKMMTLETDFSICRKNFFGPLWTKKFHRIKTLSVYQIFTQTFKIFQKHINTIARMKFKP